MKKIATHNGTFHTDDVFAVATLMMAIDDEIEIVRTRNDEEIAEADYVVDVGGEYDPALNMFDHHQIGGAGERSMDDEGNGIPYASFGLVWKHFGADICGSEDVAQVIDQRLVQPIDALDNGVDISEELIEGVMNYNLHSIVSVFRPTWRESVEADSVDSDEQFEKLVGWARVLLEREIEVTHDNRDGERKVREAYEQADDKRLIELPCSLPWDVLTEYPEPLFVIYPKEENGTWSLKCVRKARDTFALRCDLPHEWAAKRGTDLQETTGVPDALFVHRGLFVAVAGSREGILQLAKQALE